LSKLRRIAGLSALLLTPFAVYFPIWSVWTLIGAVYGNSPEPTLWSAVSAGVEATETQRAAFVALASLPILCGVITIYWAFQKIWCFWRGIVFHLCVAHATLRTGQFLAASGFLKLLLPALAPLLIFGRQPNGLPGPQEVFSNAHFALMLAGLGFVMMGAVMREAIALARENEGFI